MKRIRLSAHAFGDLDRRGFTVAEVEEAIRTGEWQAPSWADGNVRSTFRTAFDADNVA